MTLGIPQRNVSPPSMAVSDLNVRYAFGGFPESPLVSGVLEHAFDPARDLQPQLLERADALVDRIWVTQDAAFVVFENDALPLDDRGQALNVVLACQEYVVLMLLHPMPSVHSVRAAQRLRRIFDLRPAVVAALGETVFEDIVRAMHPTWARLQAIDAISEAEQRGDEDNTL